FPPVRWCGNLTVPESTWFSTHLKHTHLIYALAIADMAKGTAQPGLLRGWGMSLGIAALIAGMLMLAYFFTGAVPTRRQIVRQRLEAARQGGSMLYLSDMGLREIPEEVWGLSHLTALYLDGNRLRLLPPEIGRLENLQRLYLSTNRLESLPPEIGMLARLEWLDLDVNRLQSLPPEMARLQQLSHLKLEYNRFTAFPSVVLELPNLELLFLSGNRMGDLPPVILERAAQGDLTLWYQPRASRVDWASISVIFFCFILPVGASWLVNRWWTAREQRQQQAASQEGLVYPIPPMFRQPALFVLLTLAAVSMFVAIASFSGGMTKEAGWGIPLLFSPLMLGALVLLLHHTGLVLLKHDGIALRRGRRERFLPYSSITTVHSLPALRVKSESQTLRIPRTVHDLPMLYETLMVRISPAARQASLTRASRDSACAPDSAEDAIRFSVPRGVWGFYVGGTILFTVVYLGIALIGLWISLARGDVPPFTWRSLWDTLIIFLLVSVLFLPALIWILRSFFTA
ncbi:MAG: leucine-rich repeat domain-containing protein, partial [Anaerolineae bacterium]|nr:leucine-rich repeat domain-containing protein [Anaerolineae bacterium]